MEAELRRQVPVTCTVLALELILEPVLVVVFDVVFDMALDIVLELRLEPMKPVLAVLELAELVLISENVTV